MIFHCAFVFSLSLLLWVNFKEQIFISSQSKEPRCADHNHVSAEASTTRLHLEMNVLDNMLCLVRDHYLFICVIPHKNETKMEMLNLQKVSCLTTVTEKNTTVFIFNIGFQKYLLNCLCVCLDLYMCTIYVKVKRDARSPETRVIEGCGLPYG